MTRRSLLAAAAGTLALPTARIRRPAPSGPLIGADEVLTLGLEADWLISCREESERLLRMTCGEIADATVTVMVNGRDCFTRADLVRELRRMLTLVEGPLPLVDPYPEPYPAVIADLVPGTARVKEYRFWR